MLTKNTSKSVITLAAAAMFSLALSTTASNAAEIFSEDWESTGIADGTFDGGAGWAGSAFTLDVNNRGNLLNPNGTGNGWLNPVPSELGEIFATLHSGGTGTADLGAVFVDNLTYTLAFTHFRRDDLAGDSVTARIMTTGGDILASEAFAAVTTTDTYETRTLVWKTNGGTELGQNVRIQFFDANGGPNNIQAGIDNITLTAVPAPAALPAGLMLLGFAAMRRRRTK